MSFININIINSFNKKGDSNKEGGEVSNSSTLNNNKDINKTTSITVDSLTSNQESGNFFLSEVQYNKENKSILKQIFIGVISAVLGAIISYFIFSIK